MVENVNGIECFIAPNNWITNSGASIFRNKIITEGQILNYIDFSDYKVFDTAGIQTMVYIILKNCEKDTYKVKYSHLNCQKQVTINDLIKFLNFRLKTSDIKFEALLNRKSLKDAYIEFTKPETEQILGKMYVNKVFLNDDEIGQGIVAAPDKCFILTNIDNYSAEEKTYIKPYYTTVEKYFLPNEKRKIIYLSDKNFCDKNIKNYPNLLKHFEPYKKVLLEAKKKYGTPTKPYYYLHRERLEKFFKEGNAKLISVGRTFYPKFYYTKKAFYGSRALFFIQTQRINLKYLNGIFNSKLINFWLYYKGKKQGEQLQIDKGPLLNIPIYKPTQMEEDKIINLVDKIYDITNAEDYLENKEKQDAVKEYEKQIDIMVYKLYDLTYQEVLTIDKDFKLSEQDYNNFQI